MPGSEPGARKKCGKPSAIKSSQRTGPKFLSRLRNTFCPKRKSSSLFWARHSMKKKRKKSNSLLPSCRSRRLEFIGNSLYSQRLNTNSGGNKWLSETTPDRRSEAPVRARKTFLNTKDSERESIWQSRSQ